MNSRRWDDTSNSWHTSICRKLAKKKVAGSRGRHWIEQGKLSQIQHTLSCKKFFLLYINTTWTHNGCPPKTQNSFFSTSTQLRHITGARRRHTTALDPHQLCPIVLISSPSVHARSRDRHTAFHVLHGQPYFIFDEANALKLRHMPQVSVSIHVLEHA